MRRVEKYLDPIQAPETFTTTSFITIKGKGDTGGTLKDGISKIQEVFIVLSCIVLNLIVSLNVLFLIKSWIPSSKTQTKLQTTLQLI